LWLRSLAKAGGSLAGGHAGLHGPRAAPRVPRSAAVGRGRAGGGSLCSRYDPRRTPCGPTAGDSPGRSFGSRNGAGTAEPAVGREVGGPGDIGPYRTCARSDREALHGPRAGGEIRRRARPDAGTGTTPQTVVKGAEFRILEYEGTPGAVIGPDLGTR